MAMPNKKLFLKAPTKKTASAPTAPTASTSAGEDNASQKAQISVFIQQLTEFGLTKEKRGSYM